MYKMKKYIIYSSFTLALLLSTLISFYLVNAETGTGITTDTGVIEPIIINENIKTEEDLCFNILTENVLNNYGVDLSYVEKSSESWERINLSTYENFKKNTVYNANQKYASEWLKLFWAKRNNIWTIVASGDYILSQFSGFWDSTNFTFPLKSSNRKFDLGDKYPDFRQNIVYTHHLLSWDFVSCAYLKVTPKGTHDLYSISQDDYKTNTFEGSGFEILDYSVKKEWKDWEKEFLVWKVNISANDYADKPLFLIELTTVAYNNKSSYFNEFETFPLQVQAMTNPDNRSEWLANVMEEFYNKVTSTTCLGLVNKGSLPSKCNWTEKSLSFIDKIYSFIFPSVDAKISPVENYEKLMKKAKGLIIYDGLPYNLYKKILEIPNQNLKNALIIAIIPNFDDIIVNKENNNIILSPYEKVFSKCWMKYSERMDNVIDFVTNLNIKNIDYNNFDYLDSKFWECVIPYKDKDNIWKEVQNSFESLLKDSSEIMPITEKEENLIKEINKIENKFNNNSMEFQKKLESWDYISDEFKKSYDEKRDIFNKKHEELLIEFASIQNNLNDKETIEKFYNDKKDIIKSEWEKIIKENNNKYFYIWTIVLFLIFGFTFIIYWIIRKK